MTDKPTPTTDLLKRCAEIHEWRSTGVLSGEALRDYAKRKWPDLHDTLQMAEHETVTEALALLAKWGQPAQAAEPANGTAYAALPTSSHAGRVYEEGFLIGTCPLYTADKMRAFADATHTLRASHGQAPATQQAGIPGNFITHRAAWREALETAKFVSTGVDRSYWDHELAAFDRSFDRLWTLL